MICIFIFIFIDILLLWFHYASMQSIFSIFCYFFSDFVKKKFAKKCFEFFSLNGLEIFSQWNHFLTAISKEKGKIRRMEKNFKTKSLEFFCGIQEKQENSENYFLWKKEKNEIEWVLKTSTGFLSLVDFIPSNNFYTFFLSNVAKNVFRFWSLEKYIIWEFEE